MLVKKKLLLICRDVPANTGSTENIRLYRMIDMLRSLFDISIISESASFGINKLRNEGYDVKIDNDFLHFETNFHTIQPDYVMISRWMYAYKYINVIRDKCDARIIIDIPAVGFTQLEQRLNLKDETFSEKDVANYKEQELFAYNKADACIVTNEADHEAIVDYIDKPIFIIPHIFQLPNYKRDLSIVNRNFIYFIGDFTYTANTDALIWFCNEIFPKVTKLNPDIKLYVIGSRIPDVIRNMDNIEITDFINNVYDHLSLMNICIAPLRITSGLTGKVCEAMALGIPTIMTRLVANQLKEINLKHLDNAIIVDDNDADCFATSILKTVNSTKIIRSIAENAKKSIISYFNVNEIRNKILEALDVNAKDNFEVVNSFLDEVIDKHNIGNFDDEIYCQDNEEIKIDDDIEIDNPCHYCELEECDEKHKDCIFQEVEYEIIECKKETDKIEIDNPCHYCELEECDEKHEDCIMQKIEQEKIDENDEDEETEIKNQKDKKQNKK